jgi:excisionase family DNA binding protein
MSSAVLDRPVFAPAAEQPALRELELALEQRGAVPPVLLGADRQPRELPDTLIPLLARVVRELVRGNAVTIVPVHAELTTFEAAELLNVSRPYLVRLLDQGKIPYRKVGTHRRILAADLLKFKEGYRAKQRRALAEMAREAQEMGLYDAEPSEPEPDA